MKQEKVPKLDRVLEPSLCHTCRFLRLGELQGQDGKFQMWLCLRKDCDNRTDMRPVPNK